MSCGVRRSVRSKSPASNCLHPLGDTQGISLEQEGWMRLSGASSKICFRKCSASLLCSIPKTIPLGVVRSLHTPHTRQASDLLKLRDGRLNKDSVSFSRFLGPHIICYARTRSKRICGSRVRLGHTFCSSSQTLSDFIFSDCSQRQCGDLWWLHGCGSVSVSVKQSFGLYLLSFKLGSLFQELLHHVQKSAQSAS